MSQTDELERIKKVIVDTLKVDESQVTPDASLTEDLGADSLDLVELVMAFEDEYGVEIPDEDAQKIRTVGQALEYVHARAQA